MTTELDYSAMLAVAFSEARNGLAEDITGECRMAIHPCMAKPTHSETRGARKIIAI